MSGKFASLLAVLAVFTAIACTQPESETAAPPDVEVAEEPAPVAAEPDPTVVDPTHYTAELDNDRVRVLRITYEGGEESVMHYHPESVAVFLTDAVAQMTLPDGSAEELAAKAGDVIYTGPGQHQPKNLSDQPFEVVEVELKPSESSSAEEAGPDSTVVDPDHYTTELENDWVRVVRIAYDAGEESVMHYHPDSVAIFLTDHLVQMTMPDGSTLEDSYKAGEAIFLPAGQHLPKNISDGPWELILIELK